MMLAPQDERLSDAELVEISELLGDDGQFTQLNLPERESRVLACLLLAPGVVSEGVLVDALYHDVKERPTTAKQMLQVVIGKLRDKVRDYIEIKKTTGGYLIEPEQKELMLSVVQGGEKPKPQRSASISEDTYELESGINPPLGRSSAVYEKFYRTLDKMKVGQSFVVEAKKSNLWGRIKIWRDRDREARVKVKFAHREEDDGKIRLFRVR